MLVTPNRFTRTSQSAYWNAGNGSPDAVAFTVDRPGIVVAGVCVYGGGGHYEYEVELLDEVGREILMQCLNLSISIKGRGYNPHVENSRFHPKSASHMIMFTITVH